jgi:hypothetical protein
MPSHGQPRSFAVVTVQARVRYILRVLQQQGLLVSREASDASFDEWFWKQPYTDPAASMYFWVADVIDQSEHGVLRLALPVPVER